jgi:hypothetical protein
LESDTIQMLRRETLMRPLCEQADEVSCLQVDGGTCRSPGERRKHPASGLFLGSWEVTLQ